MKESHIIQGCQSFRFYPKTQKVIIPLYLDKFSDFSIYSNAQVSENQSTALVLFFSPELYLSNLVIFVFDYKRINA